MRHNISLYTIFVGVIYLKNLITSNWADKDADSGPIEFSIHEQDRAMIRDAIVDAVVHAPDLIRQVATPTCVINKKYICIKIILTYLYCMFRIQLAVCISNIVKYDFPGRWTQIVDKITIYLQNPDASCWPGVLLALHQLVKNFEYVFQAYAYSVM